MLYLADVGKRFLALIAALDRLALVAVSFGRRPQFHAPRHGARPSCPGYARSSDRARNPPTRRATSTARRMWWPRPICRLATGIRPFPR
jgi:hypothetical protein